MILNETAENLQNKLENLRLNMGVSASKYINKFLAWFWDYQQASTSTNSWLGFGISKKSRVKNYHLVMQSIYF
jgi:hypothetical protein